MIGTHAADDCVHRGTADARAVERDVQGASGRHTRIDGALYCHPAVERRGHAAVGHGLQVKSLHDHDQ